MLRKLLRELSTLPRFIYLLAVVAIFGLGVGAYRMVVGLGATTNLSKVFPWGIWISFDLATVALAGGAFILATLVYVFQFEDLHAALRPTILAGLVGESGVLVILLFDLGRWDHSYNVFLHPNFSSALLIVAWCLALYFALLVVEFSPVVLQKSRLRWLLPTIQKFTVPMVIVAGTLATIHQASLGTLFVIMSPRLHPLWHSMLLPVFFLISAVPAGISLVIAGATISYWLLGRSLKTQTIAKLDWFLPWLLGFYLVLKLGELQITDELGLLFSSGAYSLLFGAELIVGVLIPIILFAFRWVRTSRLGSMVGALMIIAGIVLNRFDVTWFALNPGSGQIYMPHWMEVAIVVGIAAGMVLIYSLIARYFPVFEETVAVRRTTFGAIQRENKHETTLSASGAVHGR